MRNIAGRKPVMEALKSDTKIDKIIMNKDMKKSYLTEILKVAEKRKIEVNFSDKATLDEMSEVPNHQGIVAIADEFQYKEMEDIFEFAEKKGEDPFVVILDEITDVHNLGAIIRTAECLGAHGVIIPKNRAASVNTVVDKTSAGAVEFLPVVRVTNITNTLKELKEKGLWIYGADMSGKNLYEEKLTGPIGIVIGNEGKGISRLVKENCDALVKIPMKGKINSLNASCAASIIIYDVIRQRG